MVKDINDGLGDSICNTHLVGSQTNHKNSLIIEFNLTYTVD